MLCQRCPQGYRPQLLCQMVLPSRSPPKADICAFDQACWLGVFWAPVILLLDQRTASTSVGSFKSPLRASRGASWQGAWCLGANGRSRTGLATCSLGGCARWLLVVRSLALIALALGRPWAVAPIGLGQYGGCPSPWRALRIFRRIF